MVSARIDVRPDAARTESPAGLAGARKRVGVAVAAGDLGLVTFILFTVPGPFALFAGIKGLRQIKGRPGLNGKVRAWVGIVLGGLGTVLLPLVVIVVLAGSWGTLRLGNGCRAS